MSLTPPNPTACKGCGKPIIFERQEDGRWGRPWDFDIDTQTKLEKHNCPNYKPKPKEGGWTGTNKQGQMFEARVSQDLQDVQTRNNELIIKLFQQEFASLKDFEKEVLGLLHEILIRMGKQETTREEPTTAKEEWKDLTDNEIKKIADTESIDQIPKHDGTDYGF